MQPTFGESGCVGGWSGWAVPATPSPQPEASSADKPGPPGPVSEASLSPGVGSVSPTQQILRKGSAVVAAPGPGGQRGGVCSQRRESTGESGGVGPVLSSSSFHATESRLPAQGTVHTLTPLHLGRTVWVVPWGGTRGSCPTPSSPTGLRGPFRAAGGSCKRSRRSARPRPPPRG